MQIRSGSAFAACFEVYIYKLEYTGCTYNRLEVYIYKLEYTGCTYNRLVPRYAIP